MQSGVRRATTSACKACCSTQNSNQTQRSPQYSTAWDIFLCTACALILEANRLLSGQLQASRERGGPWTSVHTGDWYALRVDDINLSSAPVEVRKDRYRYWRFTADRGHAMTAGALPVLQLNWEAERLRVLAEGPAPYLLAFGSAKAALHARDPLPPAALELREMPDLSAMATLGAAVTLSGAQALTAHYPGSEFCCGWCSARACSSLSSSCGACVVT
jgi:hypothetical protein